MIPIRSKFSWQLLRDNHYNFGVCVTSKILCMYSDYIIKTTRGITVYHQYTGLNFTS